MVLAGLILSKEKNVGDCWVLAALGCFDSRTAVLENIPAKTSGIHAALLWTFPFRFWQFGEWVDVVIDDRLPFLNGKYFCVQPRCRNEFWPSLLEKAYAKLRGSYQKLHWGLISEALVDFTGGVNMLFDLQNAPTNLRNIVLAAVKSKSLMVCQTSNREGSSNEVLENGLVQAHAYTVTGIEKVPYMNGWENLIRIWNPWGCGEWNGHWSDKSGEWEKIDVAWRKKLNVLREDGEFWMSFKDFLQHFVRIIICNRTPTCLDFEEPQKPWPMTMYANPWVKESLSRGSFIYDTFFKNPPCLVTVRESDQISKDFNVVVSLIQKPRWQQMMNEDKLPINLMVYTVNPKVLKDGLPDSHFFQNLEFSNNLVKMRDVTVSVSLKPGTYIIIPYSEHKYQELDFILRVYQRNTNYADEVSGMPADKPKMAPTKNYDDAYENIFARYCNKTSEIEASQLQKLLNEVVVNERLISVEDGGFSLDTCRGILLLMDLSVNGKLNLKEFGRLWKRLNICKNLFRENGGSQSGCLDFSALRNAVQSAGFQVTHEILNLMMLRHGDFRRINFPNFVCCMIRLEMITKVFRNLTKDGQGVYLSEEEWLQIIMSS
ncbi:calpain-14 [Microcaecilia unicolor]|uniref:Calpain-14-like n=1 Tax=Microcaecilia unicolor TaxID=1415580 RepID=A0A6P7XFK3_9AMPH|nr:calpain-14-like [Microcaecilia unicolor]